MGSCTSSDDTKSQEPLSTFENNNNNATNGSSHHQQQQPRKTGRFGRAGSTTSKTPDDPNSSSSAANFHISQNGGNNNNSSSNLNKSNNNNGVTNQHQQQLPSPPQKKKVDFFLESVVSSYCEFVHSRCQDFGGNQQEEQQQQQEQQKQPEPASPSKTKPQIADFADSTSFSINNKVRAQKLLKIFLKTAANFAHSTQRASLDEARRIVFSLSDDFVKFGFADTNESVQIEERCVDEGLYRLLEAWNQHNSSNHSLVDPDTASAMTKELDNVSPNLFDTIVKNRPGGISFGDICFMYYESACLPTTLAVFEKVQRDATALTNAIIQSQQQQREQREREQQQQQGENNNNGNTNGESASQSEFHSRRTSSGTPPPSVSPITPSSSSSPSSSSIDIAMVQLLLTDGRQKESQTNSFGIVDHSTAKDFLYRHFGGTIVEENFCTFIQSHKSNSIFDARSVSSVWQDMTQPLPNYLISSQSINSEKALNRALLDDVRSFLVKLDFVKSINTIQQQNEDGTITTIEQPVETIVVGNAKKSDLTFQRFCEAIRDRGFKKNSFPIIICFPPWENSTVNLTREREERVAGILHETLGPMLAKGLMFRGATIRDPEFSPATLRHKVLLMSSQAKLNPFIGLFVADMAKTGLGVRVTDVKEQSPAASAGVTKDDWITRIDQSAIEDKQHLRKCLAGLKIGEEFTVTRENLSHARVVVGAAVDKTDPQHASDLSNMLFFNFSGNPELQKLQQQHHQKTHHAPASVFESPHSSSNPNNIKLEKEASGGASNTAPPTPSSPEALSPNAAAAFASMLANATYAPWETAVVEERDLSISPKPIDHLALVHLNSSPSFEELAAIEAQQQQSSSSSSPEKEQQQQTSSPEKSPPKNYRKQQSEESLMSVQQFGAQLIDSHSSRAASQWARGTFVVNGHCGYVLRDSLINMGNSNSSSNNASDTNLSNLNSNNNNNNNSNDTSGTSNFTTEWTFKLITLPQEFSDVGVLRVEATVFGSAQNSVEATEIKDLVLDAEDDDTPTPQQQLAPAGARRNNSDESLDSSLNPSGTHTIAPNNNTNNQQHQLVSSPVASSPITATLQSLGRRRQTHVGSLNPVNHNNNNNNNGSNSNSNNSNNNPNNNKGNFYYTLSTTSFAKFNLSVWKAKIKANRQSRIALTVDFEDGRRIEAVLPAHLLRTGPRAVPFRVVDDELKKFPQGASIDVLCSVQRKELVSTNQSPLQQ